jgi:hypothetical protein
MAWPTSVLTELEHCCESLKTLIAIQTQMADEMQLTRQTMEQMTGVLLRLEHSAHPKGGDAA